MPLTLLLLLLAPGEPEQAGRPLSAWVNDLKSDNALVRDEALEILPRFGANGKAAAPAIKPLLKDPLIATRARAAIALWSIEGKDEATLAVLLRAARERGRQVRMIFLDAI